MWTTISSLAGLVSLGCWIYVLIKMFPAEGALKGILAIICALYAFVWGWMNRDLDANMQTVMLVWTGAIIVSSIAGSFVSSEMMANLQQLQ